MRARLPLVCLLLGAALCSASAASTMGETLAGRLGCNALFLTGDDVACLGRNLDVPFHTGYWVVNPRGVDKVAYVPGDCDETPLTWRARYGSATINAFHVDIPLGGINEAGLVVEHLAVKSKYPEPDDRPVVIPFQWVQYLLDTCSTVEEALAREQDARLYGWLFEIMHFVICDPSGAMAIVEYVPGDDGACDRRVYSGADIPPDLTALGNAPYAKHIKVMKQYRGFGGRRSIPTSRSDLARGTLLQFAYSADRVRRFNAAPVADAVPYALESLQAYTWKHTVLSIAYDLHARQVHFVSSANRDRRSFTLANLNFAPGARRYLDWHKDARPDAWTEDTDAVNRRMLNSFAASRAFGGIDAYCEELASYRAKR